MLLGEAHFLVGWWVEVKLCLDAWIPKWFDIGFTRALLGNQKKVSSAKFNNNCQIFEIINKVDTLTKYNILYIK